MPVRPRTHRQTLRAIMPRPKDTRPSAARRGYDRTWQRLRKVQLSRHPLCEHCKREGRIVPATEVDHITPIARGGERLDPNNLQSLCKACHSRKTAREDGAFGR